MYQLKRQTAEMAFSTRFFDTPPSVHRTASAPANTQRDAKPKTLIDDVVPRLVCATTIR